MERNCPCRGEMVMGGRPFLVLLEMAKSRAVARGEEALGSRLWIAAMSVWDVRWRRDILVVRGVLGGLRGEGGRGKREVNELPGIDIG